MSIDESEESENEYLFLGLSLSYDDNGKVKTVSIIKTEDTDGDYLIDIYKKIAKKVKYTALMDWKNMMHLTAPIKRLTPQSDAPSQMAFEDGDIESTHKLFESIKDINIAAYLMNPLKDTYMVDDIARDYLGITIPSYAERFQKKRLADIVNEIEEGTEDTELLKKNLLEYTSDLAYVSCLACSKLIEELKENGMYSLYVDIEMPTAYYLYQMERRLARSQ